MANRVRGEIAFKAIGKSWTLKLGVNAMCEIESEVGHSIAWVGEQLNDQKTFTIGLMRVVLWGGLLERHDGITLKEVGQLIDDIGMAEVTRLIGEAFAAATPEPKGGEPRPKKGTAA